MMTPEVYESICRQVETTSDGVNTACSDHKVSIRSFYEYKRAIGETAENRYARAKESQVDSIVDQIDEIEKQAEIELKSISDPKIAHAMMALYRLKIDDRKWLASKLKPKRYGDRLDITTAGDALPNKLQVEFISTNNPKELSELNKKLH